tara:strand:- start:1787 stop:2890 length:1104 start_codon:yes stop_codon:yes gene_type:complete
MATIGTSGGGSANTVNYDSLLSTTLFAYRKTMFDNIFKDSAFLAAMREFDGVKMQNGGERVAMPLMYGKNETVKSYEGYEVIDTTPQDGVTTAFYDWREIAGTISISRKEERQNSGESKILDLLEQKSIQAEMSLREELNRQLITGTVDSATFVPGNDAKDLNPLPWFLRKLNATDPVAGGNVGNISGSTNTWWQHKTAVADSATPDTGNAFAIDLDTYAGVKVGLRRMHNHCSRGSGGGPNLVVTDQVTYETYENALDINIRFQNTKLGELGFDTVKLKNAEMVWDEAVNSVDDGDLAQADGTAYFINTQFMKLCIDSETDIVVTPFIEPENQTAKTAKILFMGNLGCSNLRKCGVVYGIPIATVA